MSVVIIGGNECMKCKYKSLCDNYNCPAKIYTKINGTLKNKIGSPDLLIMFTGTVSHKMVENALCEVRGTDAVIERCHSSSMSALRRILEKHSQEGGALCRKR